MTVCYVTLTDSSRFCCVTSELSSNLLMVHDLQIDFNKTLVLVLISTLCLCSAVSSHIISVTYAECSLSKYPIDGGKIQTALQYFTPPPENRSQLLLRVYKLVSVLNLSQHEITSSSVKDYLKEFKLIADVAAIKRAWWAQNHVSQIWISMHLKNYCDVLHVNGVQRHLRVCHPVFKNGSAVWKVVCDPLCRYLYYLEWKCIIHLKYVVLCHP